MLNIALFGAPGAGKGTQSEKLLEHYNLVYIATGDILRNEINEGSDLGLKAKSIIDKGGLVSDELIIQIIEKMMMKHPDCDGFLFDGFPRTFVQAYILEGLLMRRHTSLTALYSLDVNFDECRKRLLNRAKTSGRSDDTAEVIEYRLEEYQRKTEPVTEFYKEKGIFIPVDGMGAVDEIFNRLTRSIGEELNKAKLNVVLLGYPGSGRGTQAVKLAEKFGLKCISTGTLLQEEIQKKTVVGKQVEAAVEAGEMISDEIVIRLIEKAIKSNPDKRGFIFKGFPRTMVQAYILDGLLLKSGTHVSTILEMKVPPLELVRRLARRGQSDKAMPYDNTTETIVKRLEDHEESTLHLAEYYEKTKKIHEVDGTGSEDEIFERLSKLVEAASRKSK